MMLDKFSSTPECFGLSCCQFMTHLRLPKYSERTFFRPWFNLTGKTVEVFVFVSDNQRNLNLDSVLGDINKLVFSTGVIPTLQLCKKMPPPHHLIFFKNDFKNEMTSVESDLKYFRKE